MLERERGREKTVICWHNNIISYHIIFSNQWTRKRKEEKKRESDEVQREKKRVKTNKQTIANKLGDAKQTVYVYKDNKL